MWNLPSPYFIPDIPGACDSFYTLVSGFSSDGRREAESKLGEVEERLFLCVREGKGQNHSAQVSSLSSCLFDILSFIVFGAT